MNKQKEMNTYFSLIVEKKIKEKLEKQFSAEGVMKPQSTFKSLKENGVFEKLVDDYFKIVKSKGTWTSTAWKELDDSMTDDTLGAAYIIVKMYCALRLDEWGTKIQHNLSGGKIIQAGTLFYFEKLISECCEITFEKFQEHGIFNSEPIIIGKIQQVV